MCSSRIAGKKNGAKITVEKRRQIFEGVHIYLLEFGCAISDEALQMIEPSLPLHPVATSSFPPGTINGVKVELNLLKRSCHVKERVARNNMKCGICSTEPSRKKNTIQKFAGY